MNLASVALASVLLALLSSAASADIVTETYTGAVIGADHAGYFGAAAANLNAGTTYTATYVFNTSVPGAYDYDNGSTFRTDGGAAGYGYPSTPSISASLTAALKGEQGAVTCWSVTVMMRGSGGSESGRIGLLS
jgi:hypothetical protein